MGKIRAKSQALLDDGRFAHVKEWGEDPDLFFPKGCSCTRVNGLFHGFHKRLSCIGVVGRVDHVESADDPCDAVSLGPGCSQG